MEKEKDEKLGYREAFRRLYQAKLRQKVEEEYRKFRKHIRPAMRFCGKEYRRLMSYKILFFQSMMDFLSTSTTLTFEDLDKLLTEGDGKLLEKLWVLNGDRSLYRGDSFIEGIFDSFYYHDYMKAEQAQYIQ